MKTTGAIGLAMLFAALCLSLSGCEREPRKGEIETPVSVPGLTSTHVDVPPRSTAP
jgi:starvation-inducible outer membrane lipoprotein